MFTTREAVFETTGVGVDQTTLATAQMMVEAYIGKMESDITDAGDRALLGRAVTFQAVYINGQVNDIMEQVAIKSTVLGETNISMNLDLMAPFMSPWAVLSCKNLSWAKTRSVLTGPMYESARRRTVWERD